jgi:hypothetical protein
MAWVRFLANFDFEPDARGGRVSLAYKAGQEVNVTRECAAKAIAAGKAKAIRPKKRTSFK